MSDVTDDMVQAFAEAIDLWVGAGKEAGTTRADMYRYAIAAVLAAAPAVEDEVWCDEYQRIHGTSIHAYTHGVRPCTTHRSLLLGPEAT